MLAEEVLQDEEFLLKRVGRGRAVLLLDGLLPHAHKLPLFELTEERHLLNVVVRVALDQPLAEGNELNGGVHLVESQTLAGERVVLVLKTFVVGGDLQVVRVAGVLLGIQVHEHSLLLTLAIEK